MTLDREDKKVLSDVRMEKAREFLDDARANLKDSRYKTSVNRSYYAVLNAARSVLILEGINPESHAGISTMLSLRCIKPGLLPQKVIKDFKLLLSRRTDVDYGDFDTIDSSDAEDSFEKARTLIEEIDSLRSVMIKSLLSN